MTESAFVIDSFNVLVHILCAVYLQLLFRYRYKFLHFCVEFYMLFHTFAVSLIIFYTYTARTEELMKTNNNKKAQLSLTNPRDACEKFARFT